MESPGKKMLESAQALITKTAEKMRLDGEMIKRLIEPEFAHEFALTITMDNGKKKVTASMQCSIKYSKKY